MQLLTTIIVWYIIPTAATTYCIILRGYLPTFLPIILGELFRGDIFRNIDFIENVFLLKIIHHEKGLWVNKQTNASLNWIENLSKVIDLSQQKTANGSWQDDRQPKNEKNQNFAKSCVNVDLVLDIRYTICSNFVCFFRLSHHYHFA